MNSEFTGLFIPREILLIPSLSLQEKCVLSTIKSLEHPQKGGCFASNDYLINFLDISLSSLKVMLKKFTDQNLLEKVSFNGRTRVLKTIIPGMSESMKFKRKLGTRPTKTETIRLADSPKSGHLSYIDNIEDSKNNNRDVAVVSFSEKKLKQKPKPETRTEAKTDNIGYDDNNKFEKHQINKKVSPDKPLNVIRNNSDDPIVVALISTSQENKDPFTPDLIRNLSSKYEIQRIESQINNYRRNFTSKGTKADNPAGWLTCAVKNNYEIPKEVISDTQAEALKYNEFLKKKGHHELHESNKKTIMEENSMKIFLCGGLMNISLINTLQDLRNDFKMSMREMCA